MYASNFQCSVRVPYIMSGPLMNHTWIVGAPGGRAHACRQEGGGRALRHATAGYSKLCDILGHHRLQVVVCGRLDDEALARVVSLEELGDVEEQQRHMKHLGVDRV